MIKLIEESVIGHFEYLPRLAGYPIFFQQNFRILNCGLNSSMFNIAHGYFSDINIDLIKQEIASLIKNFSNQPFALWIPPSSCSINIDKILIEHGFIIENPEYAMICDLKNQNNKIYNEHIIIEQVQNQNQLNDFVNIIAAYDESAVAFYNSLTLNQLQLKEKLFIGYYHNQPVCEGLLFQNANVAAIFSLITVESMRNIGLGSQMMQYLINVAIKNNAKFLTLTASSESSRRIYEQLNFKTLGQYKCFEWRS